MKILSDIRDFTETEDCCLPIVLFGKEKKGHRFAIEGTLSVDTRQTWPGTTDTPAEYETTYGFDLECCYADDDNQRDPSILYDGLDLDDYIHEIENMINAHLEKHYND